MSTPKTRTVTTPPTGGVQQHSSCLPRGWNFQRTNHTKTGGVGPNDIGR